MEGILECCISVINFFARFSVKIKAPQREAIYVFKDYLETHLGENNPISKMTFKRRLWHTNDLSSV
jgi:hypothetical protein